MNITLYNNIYILILYNSIIIQSVCTEHVIVWFSFATWMLIGFGSAQIVSLVSDHCQFTCCSFWLHIPPPPPPPPPALHLPPSFYMWILILYFFTSISSQIAVLPMSALKLKENTHSWTLDTFDEYSLNHEHHESSSRETTVQMEISALPTAPPEPLHSVNTNQRFSVTSNHIVCPHCHQHNVLVPL